MNEKINKINSILNECIGRASMHIRESSEMKEMHGMLMDAALLFGELTELLANDEEYDE